jgi:choline dehydrogenase-like flavoprotein
MNHPKGYHGEIVLHEPITELPAFFGCMYNGFAGYVGYTLSHDVQKKEALLNSYIRFEPVFPWSEKKGVPAFVYGVKQLKSVFTFIQRTYFSRGVIRLREYEETGDDSIFKNVSTVREVFQLCWYVLRDFPAVLQYLTYRMRNTSMKVDRIRIRNFLEMEPRFENRLMLADEKDVYGQPRIAVSYAIGERDKDTMVQLHHTLKEAIETSGVGIFEGRLTAESNWDIFMDASHYLGTTRMGISPTTSVVDGNLQVHGMQNLFVLGGSVFPTSGNANPTFTICALAIRLADHLSRMLKK